MTHYMIGFGSWWRVIQGWPAALRAARDIADRLGRRVEVYNAMQTIWGSQRGSYITTIIPHPPARRRG